MRPEHKNGGKPKWVTDCTGINRGNPRPPPNTFFVVNANRKWYDTRWTWNGGILSARSTHLVLQKYMSITQKDTPPRNTRLEIVAARTGFERYNQCARVVQTCFSRSNPRPLVSQLAASTDTCRKYEIHRLLRTKPPRGNASWRTTANYLEAIDLSI